MSNPNLKDRLAQASQHSRLHSRGQEKKEDLKQSLMTSDAPSDVRYHVYGSPHDLEWLKDTEATINQEARRKEKTNRSELVRAAIHLLKQKSPDEIKTILANLD